VRDYNGNDQALAAHRATADHDAVQADKGTRTLRGFGDRSAAAARLTRFGEPSLARRHSARWHRVHPNGAVDNGTRSISRTRPFAWRLFTLATRPSKS